MKRTIISIILVVVSVGLYSQGFKKASRTEKISTHELGNYHLYKHQSDSLTVYSFDMRDRKYSINHFLQVKLGTKDEAITFLKNAIETIETMKKGDQFELGLPDNNTGFYAKLVTNTVLGITVGDIGEYGYLPKSIAKGMLKKLEKE